LLFAFTLEKRSCMGFIFKSSPVLWTRETPVCPSSKAELISWVHSSASNLNKAQARQAVESIPHILKTCLENGEDVLLSRFGKFNINVKSAREGRNPQTGEPVILEARRVVTFKPSGILREKVNAK